MMKLYCNMFFGFPIIYLVSVDDDSGWSKKSLKLSKDHYTPDVHWDT